MWDFFEKLLAQLPSRDELTQTVDRLFNRPATPLVDSPLKRSSISCAGELTPLASSPVAQGSPPLATLGHDAGEGSNPVVVEGTQTFTKPILARSEQPSATNRAPVVVEDLRSPNPPTSGTNIPQKRKGGNPDAALWHRLDVADPEQYMDIRDEYERDKNSGRQKGDGSGLIQWPFVPKKRNRTRQPSPQTGRSLFEGMFDKKKGARNRSVMLSNVGRMLQTGAGKLASVGRSVPGVGSLATGMSRVGQVMQMAGGAGTAAAAGGVAGGAGGGAGAAVAGGAAAATALAPLAIPLAIAATVAALAGFTIAVKSSGESLLDEIRARYQNYSGKIASTGAMTEFSRMQMDMRTARETEDNTVELAAEMKLLREQMQPLESAFQNLKLDVFTGLTVAATKLATATNFIVENWDILTIAILPSIDKLRRVMEDLGIIEKDVAEELKKQNKKKEGTMPQQFLQGWQNADVRAAQREPLRPLP